MFYRYCNTSCLYEAGVYLNYIGLLKEYLVVYIK